MPDSTRWETMKSYADPAAQEEIVRLRRRLADVEEMARVWLARDERRLQECGCIVLDLVDERER